MKLDLRKYRETHGMFENDVVCLFDPERQGQTAYARERVKMYKENGQLCVMVTHQKWNQLSGRQRAALFPWPN